MQKVLNDSAEFYTSEGVFKRETILYKVGDDKTAVEEHFYFNGVEYSDVSYVIGIIGEDGIRTAKNEIETNSNLLDAYIYASTKKYIP